MIAPAAAILADSCVSADEKEAHWDKVQLLLTIPTGFVSAPSMFLCLNADPLVCSEPWCNLIVPPECDIISGWYHAVVTEASTGACTVTLTRCRIHKKLGLSVSRCDVSALHFSKGVTILSFLKATWPLMHLCYNVNYYKKFKPENTPILSFFFLAGLNLRWIVVLLHSFQNNRSNGDVQLQKNIFAEVNFKRSPTPVSPLWRCLSWILINNGTEGVLMMWTLLRHQRRRI